MPTDISFRNYTDSNRNAAKHAAPVRIYQATERERDLSPPPPFKLFPKLRWSYAEMLHPKYAD